MNCFSFYEEAKKNGGFSVLATAIEKAGIVDSNLAGIYEWIDDMRNLAQNGVYKYTLVDELRALEFLVQQIGPRPLKSPAASK